MSIKIMTLVWGNTTLRGSDRLVLLALADNANDEGVCWPSLNTIASKANISRRQAKRATDNLCEIGLLTREPRTRPNGSITSNTYQIVISAIVTPASPVTPMTLDGDADDTPPSDADDTPPMTPMSPPEPSLEPSLRTEKESNNGIFSDLTDEACVALYCETTDQFAMPNTTRTQNDIKIIRGSIERLGKEATRDRMSVAWQWWKSCKAKKTGKPYSPYNTGWIDRLQDNDPLPAHTISKDAQQGADGSFYA